MLRMKELPVERRLELYRRAMELAELGWDAAKIGREIGVCRGTVYDWKIGRRKPEKQWKFPDLSPSEELSYVLGVYYGDGCASIRKKGLWMSDYSISLSVTDKDFVEEFGRCLSKILHKDYPIHKREGTSAWGKHFARYELKACNRLLYEYLKKPLESHKTLIEEFPASFVRGFFDSEGNAYRIYGKHSYNLVQASNTNLSLLEYIQDLFLRRFSINSKIYVEKRIGLKTVYRLSITSYPEIVKFQEIGFSIHRKQQNLIKIKEKQKKLILNASLLRHQISEKNKN